MNYYTIINAVYATGPEIVITIVYKVNSDFVHLNTVDI